MGRRALINSFNVGRQGFQGVALTTHFAGKMLCLQKRRSALRRTLGIEPDASHMLFIEITVFDAVLDNLAVNSVNMDRRTPAGH